LAGSARAWCRWHVAVLVGGAACAAVVALAARAGAAQNAEADADARELKAYRLTMPKVRQMNDAYLTFFKSLQSDPQFLALQKTREELHALEKKDELTEADERRIAQLEAEIEEAEDIASMGAGEEQSLGDMEKTIETQPRFAAAIRKAGLTPREFATIQLALFQAMFAHGFMKSGATKELPEEIPPENVAFVREHEAELTAMAKQWQGLAGEPTEVDLDDAEVSGEDDPEADAEDPEREP
jgi:hypothetical protein